MAFATPIDGIGLDNVSLTGARTLTRPQPTILTGYGLRWDGQTANTSASNVANQQVGTVQIPSGTADGATVTITNSQITANSLIFLQLKGAAGKKVILDAITPAGGSATFTVRTTDAAATVSNCDCWYMIVN